MKDLALLLAVPWRAFRNRSARLERGESTRILALGSFGVVFWIIVFQLMWIVLEYFLGLGVMGDLLAKKLLSMVMLMFMSFLVFSAIINTVSTFFVSDDLDLLNSMPLDAPSHFLARYAETLWESSYMLFVFGIPVLAAYGAAFEVPAHFYPLFLLLFVPYLIIPVSAGVMLTMLLVNALPAQRLRDVMMILGVIVVAILFLMLRFLRPERLLQAEEIEDFARFFASLDVPSSYLLPSEMFSTAFFDLILAVKGFWGFNAVLLYLTAFASIAICGLVYRIVYVGGFQKAQEARRVFVSRGGFFNRLLLLATKGHPPVRRAILHKDVRTFMRDPAQWSQIFLLGALLGVYLYSLSALPIDFLPQMKLKAQNAVAFINLGLAGFTISALSARFVFPAVSLEGRAIWIVRTAPIETPAFLWSKFFVNIGPLALIALTLIVLSNLVLQTAPFIMILCTAAMAGMTVGIVALGIGFGARFPMFRHDNVAKIPVSYGGIMYMIVSLAFVGAVVVLLIYPVATWFQYGSWNATPLVPFLIVISCLLLALLTVAVAIFAPMRMGIRYLDRREAW